MCIQVQIDGRLLQRIWHGDQLRKYKFMVVNGNETDKMPITVQGCTVLHCLAYTYLSKQLQ